MLHKEENWVTEGLGGRKTFYPIPFEFCTNVYFLKDFLKKVPKLHKADKLYYQ